MKTIYTVGHSSRDIDSLIGLLEAQGVVMIADIRRFPASRRYPRFNRSCLRRTLECRGIGYTWMEALRCHRLYVSDTFVTRGWRVLHITGHGGIIEHHQQMTLD